MPQPGTLGERIVRQRFAAIAEVYDATIGARRQVYNQAVDAIVLDRVRDMPGLTLLDAGCGTAVRSAELKRQLPHARVVGVDASAPMIERARAQGLDEVRVGRLDEIDDPDGSFDAITCLFFVICYLTTRAERERAIANFHRLLKPGGLLFVDAINLWHLGEGLDFRRSPLEAGWDYLRSLLDPRLSPGDKLYSTTHDGRQLPGFFHGFSHRSLARLLRGAGFVIDHQYTIGYNSGGLRRRFFEGQILHVCHRPAEAR